MAPPKKFKKGAVNFTYRVDASRWAQVAAIARDNEETLTEIFDRFVDEYIKKHVVTQSDAPGEEKSLVEIDAEIAELEAKYGTTPNAKTAAAILEGRAGKVKSANTIEEFFEAMHRGNEEN